MPRPIWKGAITFGLVNVPISLYPASQEAGQEPDLLRGQARQVVGMASLRLGGRGIDDQGQERFDEIHDGLASCFRERFPFALRAKAKGNIEVRDRFRYLIPSSWIRLAAPSTSVMVHSM